MTHSYLLEVGVEEMPAHVVTKSIAQLHQRVANGLTLRKSKSLRRPGAWPC